MKRISLAVLLAAATAAPPRPAAAFDFRPLAVQGLTIGGADVVGSGSVHVSDAGAAYFSARVNDGGVVYESVYDWNGGSPTLVTRYASGTPFPGRPIDTGLTGIGLVKVLADGSFVGEISETNANALADRGTYLFGPGASAVAKYVHEFDRIDLDPGPANTNDPLNAATGALVNSSGYFMLRTSVWTGLGGTTTGTSDVFNLRGTIGVLEVFAQEGFATPGLPDGTLWSNAGPTGLNNAGTIIGTGVLKTGTTTVTAANDRVIWTGDTASNAITVLAREGAQPVGGGTDRMYRTLPTAVTLAEDGRMTFSAEISDLGGSVPSREQWVYLGTPDDLRVVLREGDALPSITGGTFDRPNSISLANDERTLINVTLIVNGTSITDRNNRALYAGQGDDFTLVAQGDTQAPGLPAGTVYGSSFSNVLGVNDLGQGFFSSSVRPAGSDGAGTESLFAYDPEAGAALLLQVGRPFEVVPGDVRTIFSFNPRLLDNDGRLVVGLTFRSATGTITSGTFITTIPEPASLALMAAGGAIATIRRRR